MTTDKIPSKLKVYSITAMCLVLGFLFGYFILKAILF